MTISQTSPKASNEKNPTHMLNHFEDSLIKSLVGNRNVEKNINLFNIFIEHHDRTSETQAQETVKRIQNVIIVKNLTKISIRSALKNFLIVFFFANFFLNFHPSIAVQREDLFSNRKEKTIYRQNQQIVDLTKKESTREKSMNRDSITQEEIVIEKKVIIEKDHLFIEEQIIEKKKKKTSNKKVYLLS